MTDRRRIDGLAIDDRPIQALRCVRDNRALNLRVADLAVAAGIRGRGLPDRFRRFLCRTTLDEIQRCRVERITRLLIETDLTIWEIAAIGAFEVDARVVRFFSPQPP